MQHDSSISGMQADIEAARRKEEELFAPDDDEPPVEIDTTFVRSCLHNEERGDGILFAAMNRDKFVLVKNWGQKGTWLRWTEHHWEEDRRDMAHNAVDLVAERYHQYMIDLKPELQTAKEKLRAAEEAIRRTTEETPVEEILTLQSQKIMRSVNCPPSMARPRRPRQESISSAKWEEPATAWSGRTASAISPWLYSATTSTATHGYCPAQMECSTCAPPGFHQAAPVTTCSVPLRCRGWGSIASARYGTVFLPRSTRAIRRSSTTSTASLATRSPD